MRSIKARIFDIQRGSLVDGDGIRTTVFFKGCNLACKWCHNPEGIGAQIKLAINKNLCTDCKKCYHVCKNGLKSCDFCGECVIYCPQGAREIYGKEYTHTELLDVILSDKDYYEQSGGGVTLSGGECLIQIDFVAELLRLCKQNGVNTAVDTAGNVPYEYFERILPYTDMIIYDVKCVSDDLHKIGTGVSNEKILNNLVTLCANYKDKIRIRVPIIGGFNNKNDEIEKIQAFISKLGVTDVEYISYHKMAQHKYESLGMEFTEFYEIPKDELKKISLGEKQNAKS